MVHQPAKGAPVVKQDPYKNRRATPYVAALDETGFTRDGDGQDDLAGAQHDQEGQAKGPAPQQQESGPDLSGLLDQICKLGDSQRHQLFMVLKELESNGSLSG